MRPSWGIKEGVRSEQLVLAGRQAWRLLGGGFRSSREAGVIWFPGPGWPRRWIESLPQQAGSFPFQARRFQCSNVAVSFGGWDRTDSACGAGEPG